MRIKQKNDIKNVKNTCFYEHKNLENWSITYCTKIIPYRMRNILTILFVLISKIAFNQTDGDTKIIITLIDNAGMYEKVKIALVKNDFVVKEDGNKDTLQTYSREFSNLQGYSIVKAILNDKQITLCGVYGLKKINDWGYTTSP